MVTGASSGLGSAFARWLAGYGARVVVAARRKERLDALVAEIRDAGGEAVASRLDVTDGNSVAAAFDLAEDAFGTVQILANNAGVADSKPALEVSESDWDFTIDTNLKGAWLVAREAGQRLVAAGLPGSIVNTASILGLRVAPTLSSYSASKAAVVSLTQSLALEWGRAGIRVNALCPGYFVTEMNEAFFETQQGQDYLRGTPAGRNGEIDELEAPFMLLASDAGSFVNGVALPVDGAHSVGNI